MIQPVDRADLALRANKSVEYGKFCVKYVLYKQQIIFYNGIIPRMGDP